MSKPIDSKDGEQQFRRWTAEELHQLFSSYFARLPGTCPVCYGEVRMMMDHKNGTTMLDIRCDSCKNRATVFS